MESIFSVVPTMIQEFDLCGNFDLQIWLVGLAGCLSYVS